MLNFGQDSEVREKFWLGSGSAASKMNCPCDIRSNLPPVDPYGPVIDYLKTLPDTRKPSAMLECACQTTRMIVATVDAFYAGKTVC